MKKKLAVLFGGCSTEYPVSLQSAHAVLTHIDPAAYDVYPLGITRDGRWFRYLGAADALLDDTWHTDPALLRPAFLSPDRAAHGMVELADGKPTVIRLDLVFPVLHGKNGEDGTVQGLCELAGIPLAGCGALASALCMDKDRAHRLAGLAGVQYSASFVITPASDASDTLARAERIGYPLFVKPVRAGSSFGISRVTARADLPRACKLAFEHDGEVVLEQAVPGFEVGCAVMGNDTLTVGEVDEIELSGGFFDYTEKYTLKTSRIQLPARISPEKAAEVKQTAQVLYKALGCRGFARVDLFLTPEGTLYFNEINTIPGFTAHSRFPNMMKAAGHTFAEVVAAILELGAAQ